MILAGVVRARMRMAVRSLLPTPGTTAGGRFQGLIGLALVAVFCVLVYLGLAATFSSLAIGSTAIRAAQVLALVLVATVVGIAAFDLHYAVTALLLDSDLDLLRRAPLARASLFAIKLADSLPRTGALLVVLALPATLAFAKAFPLPFWAWPLIPLVLAGLWAVPLGAGVALALLLVRRLPPQMARDMVALLSTLMLTLLWLANSFVVPRLVTETGRFGYRLPESQSGPVLELSPPHWAARAIAAAHQSDVAAALGWSALLVATAALSLGCAAWAAGGSLDAALARVTPGALRRDASRRTRSRSAGASGLISAVALRDLKLFARDWTVLGDVVVAAALWMLLPLVGASVVSASPHLLVRAMLLVLAAGLGYEVAARSVPLERSGLAWCRLAPVLEGRWVAGKLAGAGVISLALLGLAAATLALAFTIAPSEWFQTLIAAVSALALSLSLGLWSGATFGDPRWTNPRSMLTLAGRLVATGLLVLQAAGWIALLGLADTYRILLPEGALTWGPPLVAALLSLPALAATSARLRRLEWVW